jgi:hypothetical protein
MYHKHTSDSALQAGKRGEEVRLSENFPYTANTTSKIFGFVFRFIS